MEKFFTNRVPDNAVRYCEQLREQYDFYLKITAARKSKLGDFRYYPDGRKYMITLNGNMHPYLFLITYLHELAHLVVHMQYGSRVKPHGAEWKIAFRKLAIPVLNKDVFPEDLLTTLIHYFRNPKAGFYGHAGMAAKMESFQTANDDETAVKLGALKDGQCFTVKGRKFKKIALKRSRVLCLQLDNQKKYLIHQLLKVQIAD